MKRYALAALLMLGIASPALAKELAGVKLTDTIQVDGKTLHLNGMGLRKKFIFDVYVAGLYLEKPSTSGEAILKSDTARTVRMVMRRDLDSKSIVDAIRTGFEKNAGDKLPALQERLNTFTSAIPAVKANDVLSLTYIPGQGTKVESKSGKAISVEGKDFADALFSVFIGKYPVDEAMKRGMLEGK